MYVFCGSFIAVKKGYRLLKKIMFFILSLKIGGSEKACVRAANALADSCDVTVCTVFGGGELQKELSEKVHIKNAYPNFIRGAARVISLTSPKICYKKFVKDKYDIEIAVGDGLESHIISGGDNPDRFSWIHMDVRFHGNDNSSKTQRRYSAFKKIICVSETAKKGFIAKYGFEEKCVVAFTPVELENVIKKSDEFVPDFQNYYVAVGRLEEVKGYDRLIRAVSKIGNIRLVIVGDGTRRNELQSLIDELEIADRVTLTGQVTNPYPYIKHAKALICSSLNESFGFVAVEAMALLTPVISVKCGGTEEIINSPRVGILCDNNTVALCDAISGFDCGEYNIDLPAAKDRAYDFSPEKTLCGFMNIIDVVSSD